MSNPFDILASVNDTDDNYADRVEFFLSLKEKVGALNVKAVAKDEVKALLKSKGVSTAKLRSSLGGKMNKPKDIPGYSSKLGPSGKQVKAPPVEKSKDIKAPKSETKKKLVEALKRMSTK